MLSAGNKNDISVAQTLLERFDLMGKLVIADKGYDSDKLVKWIEVRGGVAIIPSRVSARQPRDIHEQDYAERHLIENLFLKLKHNPRFATRYEKKAIFFRALVFIACALIWLT